MDGLYRYVRRPKGMVFKSFWSEIGYVNWVCFLGEATSSSFGDEDNSSYFISFDNTYLTF